MNSQEKEGEEKKKRETTNGQFRSNIFLSDVVLFLPIQK
jgi:hypothetical protein